MEKIKVNSSPCVYFLYDNSKIVYIGKTYNLLGRIGNHTNSNKIFTHYTYKSYDNASDKQLSSIERSLIKKHKPKYNTIHNPNKRKKKKI